MKQLLRVLMTSLHFLIAVPVAMAIEEPAFEVVTSNDAYEIRAYAPYIVAETNVSGDLGSAGGEAFRILAGYIFGKNDDGEKMKMTAPVESRALTDATPMSTTSSGGEDAYTFGFVMEERYTLDSLPTPDDDRITLREVPARTVAAHRYSGRWTDGNYYKHKALLMAALERDGLIVTAQPLLARYNGPMTPWFLRRNEVLVEVQRR